MEKVKPKFNPETKFAQKEAHARARELAGNSATAEN